MGDSGPFPRKCGGLSGQPLLDAVNKIAGRPEIGLNFRLTPVSPPPSLSPPSPRPVPISPSLSPFLLEIGKLTWHILIAAGGRQISF